jgi:hypothetical protein
VIAFGAMLALARTSVSNDELHFFEIFKIFHPDFLLEL